VKFPYSMTPTKITVMVDGKMRVVDATNNNYAALKAELRKPNHDAEILRDLTDMRYFISKISFGKVEIDETEVRYQGKKIHNSLTDRLLAMIKDGDDCEPIARFTENVMQNTRVDAVDKLFEWLERGSMPITPDGCFIAFKKVRADGFDVHSGTVHYAPGKTVKKDISANSYNDTLSGACGHGLHFCSFDYLGQFGGDKVFLVQINPKDVIGIDPSDTSKGQTTSMFVLSEMPQEELKRVVVGKNVMEPPVESKPTPVAEVAKPVIEPEVQQAINTPVAPQPEIAVPTNPKPKKETTKVPVTVKNNGVLKFAHAGKTWTEAQLKKAVKGLSSRAAATALGVPRTTLQGWLKQLPA
jgi:hypothetical protein